MSARSVRDSILLEDIETPSYGFVCLVLAIDSRHSRQYDSEADGNSRQLELCLVELGLSSFS